MESFKDSNGKFWDLHLNIGLAKKIKSRFDLDLVGGDPTAVITRLSDEPFTRSEIMWLMVVEPGDMEQDDFYALLTGSVYREASKAFWETIVNFIQEIDPIRARAISKIKIRLEMAMEEQTNSILEVMESEQVQEIMERGRDGLVSKALEKMEKALVEKLGESSTNSVVPSEE